MFRPDQPIQSRKDDDLGRSSFAQALGEAILKYQEKESVVIGLFGAWGSGKTSVVNMALEYIDAVYNDKSNENKPIIIRFNPWNYSDQNQLITQFFNQLSVTLKRPDYGSDAKKAGEKLETYAEFFEPLTLIPGLGFMALFSKVFKNVGGAAKSWGEQKSKDLNSIKALLNELLNKLSHKIIIVIDDIDRLNNTEIRQIFQLIKSLGDFHNTIYLLAFDKNVVINALEKVQEGSEGSGLEYLEKIVQVPFEIPLISKQEIDRLVFSQIKELTKDIPEERWDQVDWDNKYHSGLTHFFNTIRDVTRYINSLKFGFNLVKDDVNTADFLAIIALQVFVPEVYYGIRENKQLFTGVFDSRDDGPREQAQKRCDEIIERTNKLPQEELKGLLTSLFPKLDTIYGNIGSHKYDFLTAWRKSGRICSPDIFEIFFRLSLPEGDISQKEMKTILSLANNPAAFSEALLNLNEDRRILKFLERLGDYIDSDIPEEHIEPIVTVLMDIGDRFPETDYRLPHIWFYELMHRFDSQEKRFNIFKRAIENATQSLWTITDEVSLETGRHGKYDPERETWSEEKLTVNAEHLEELENLACGKIEQWANDGRLEKHPKLSTLLVRWKTWGNPEQVERFVHDIIATDEGVLDFIVSFLSPVKTSGLSDYVPRLSWRIPLNYIEEFVDVKHIEPRIRTIFSSSKFTQLDDKKQLAVKTFLDTIDGKIRDRF